MSEIIGTLLNERYRLDAEIGRGGLGVVYRAHDTLLDRDVAVKVLSATTLSAESRARLLREAQAAARLNHPNIVSVYDAGEAKGVPFIVMELVEGESLHSRRPQALEEILSIVRQVCAALEHAHAYSIVHRDLKPENVLIAPDGCAKLMDFGLARTVASRLTTEGTIVGTVFYLAPEQALGQEIDGRADLYALGVLLYELTTGQLPFTGDDMLAVISQHLHAPVVPPSTHNAAIPPALDALIVQLLSKQPEDRPASAAEVQQALDDLSRPEAISATPVSPQITARKHNLPVQLTPFFGREADLAQIADRLQDPACRLLTLVGPGGSGKTRLALEAGAAQVDNFAHGVFFVSLAPLDSVKAIVPTVAEALGFSFYEEGEPQQQLLDYLHQKTMLLILDNFEHLLDGAGVVTEVLKTAPDVRILATSRARLNVQGEHLFPIAGMDFPALIPREPKEAAQYSAVKLFLQSARWVQPSFELTADNVNHVTRICRLVEGMPLGILLAAAWVQMLTPAEIAAEIGQGLDFLETDLRDMPERQRSMRAVFDHSWHLLTGREREVFGGLSVFRGGFTRQAAQRVTGASLRELRALVNKSLLQRTPMGRYEVHELLRQYAAGKLDQSPAASEAVRDRHCAYYAAALQEWEADLKGPREQAVLAEIEADSENARAAWNWAVERGHVEYIEQAIEGLCLFYDLRWRYQEGEAACRMAAEKLGATASGDGPDLSAVEGLPVLAKILAWQSVFSRELFKILRGTTSRPSPPP
jgi:predicted ATPase/predicted Ser/Thr protein kinase